MVIDSITISFLDYSRDIIRLSFYLPTLSFDKVPIICIKIEQRIIFKYIFNVIGYKKFNSSDDEIFFSSIT